MDNLQMIAPESLRELERRLLAASESTEGAFLRLGAQLIDLQTRAREISLRASGFAELVSNDAGFLNVLEDLLASSGQQCDLDGISETIEKIRKTASATNREIAAVQPIANTFHVLAVMTRIESARSADFGTASADLANSVTKLSVQIGEQTSVMSESAAALLENTTRAAVQARKAAAEYKENLVPLAARTAVELRRFKNHCNFASEAGKRLASRFELVSRRIGDIVSALQSHDIVRQQIQHVIEAIGAVAATPASLREIAPLQAAQLANSRKIFERSVIETCDCLKEIELTISEVDHESASLLGLGETSLLAQMQAGLEDILATLERNQQVINNIAGLTGLVHARIADISKTIAGVHAMGRDMQHIALNATIQAGRLGAHGAPVRIIADNIRSLAQSADQAWAKLQARLSAMQQIAASFGDDAAKGDHGRTQILELRQSIDTLNSAAQQTIEEHALIAGKAAGLQTAIGQALQSFGNQDEFLHTLTDAVATLSGISLDQVSADEAGLNQLARYTMHSERAVHHQVFGVDDVSTASVDQNVEFF